MMSVKLSNPPTGFLTMLIKMKKRASQPGYSDGENFYLFSPAQFSADAATDVSFALQASLRHAVPGTYDITLEPKGFTCDCPGFTFRGKCKHTLNVNNRIKEAIYGEVPEYYTL